MSRSIQLALFAFLFTALAVLYYLYFSSSRIVYVESARLINNYQGMIDARKAYKTKASVWKSNIDSLTNDVQQAIMDYEKDSRSMTNKEKELSKKLINTKQKQLADYQKAIQDKASQEDQERTQMVLQEVNQYIKEYGEKNGYKIILAATEYGNLAYATDDLDITDKIIEGLNKKYSGN